MLKIRDYTLSAEMAHKLRTILENLPDWVFEQEFVTAESLADDATSRAKGLRQQLIEAVQSDGNLADSLVEVLERALPHRSSLAVLSQEAILHCFPGLCDLLGREELLLALLVDPRPELSRFAAEKIQHPPALRGESSREAALDLQFKVLNPLRPLLFRLDCEGERIQNKSEAQLAASNKQLREEVATLKADIQDRIQRHKKNLDKLSSESARKTARLEDEKQKSQQNLQQVTAEKVELEKRLADQALQRERLVADGVRAQTNAITKKWLVLLEQTEERMQAALPASADVLRRAEAIWAAQVAQDRHTGNRAQLQARHQELSEMQRKLTTAAESAIARVPGLLDVNQEIQQQIAKIQRILTSTIAMDPAAERLLVRINQTASTEEVGVCAEVLKSIEATELISPGDCKRLYDALHRKYSLLEERTKAPVPVKDTGWSLRGVLHRNEPCLLLLDGHNLLFRLQDVFGDAYENGVPGTKARDALVNVVKRLAARRSKIQVKVCFDGPHQSTREEAENIEVAFSGGEGENRADNLLLGYLPLMRSMGGTCFGVTDDGAVRAQLTCSGALYVPCSLFAVLLDDFECLTALHGHTK